MTLEIQNREIYKIKNKYGELDIFFEPKSLLERYSNLTYERPYIDHIKNNKYNYDWFIDIGAAWGFFVRIAAKYYERVTAIEAHPLRYGFLKWNTRDLSNVHTMYKYITNNLDIIPQISPDPIRMIGVPGQNYIIQKMKLSQLADGKQFEMYKTLIKMDIEGGELSALSSANHEMIEFADWIIDYHPFANVNFEKVKRFFPSRKVEKHPMGNKIFVTD